jgi:thymidine phosphorylase
MPDLLEHSQAERNPVATTHHARRLGIETGHEAVVYLHRDSVVVRSEGFESQTRIQVRVGDRTILATLGVVSGSLLAVDEAGFSEAAWNRLRPSDDEVVHFAHQLPLDSLRYVRAKVYGQRLNGDALAAIIRDVSQGQYSDIQLASFLTACADGRLDLDEMVDLTLAMVESGERLRWPQPIVVDKHSVGGIPGNRTSLIVVPIVAAAGLLMPKTSSRAITSPAGTADTMETLAPVNLDLPAMRRVVEQEGACLVWGGRARLSPADDVLIRVERSLDLDSPGQLVASVLSKKAAAGATHVVIDIPVGPTAKLRSPADAERLSTQLREVGGAVGLQVLPVLTQGAQPIGRGIGPALEARDALAVLQGDPSAPCDLRDRAVLLAGSALELASAVPSGKGNELARTILNDGRAWRKFQAICQAQGGMRTPPRAKLTRSVLAGRSGRVKLIDNRRLARVAKLAGAPHDPAAGLELHVRLGDRVSEGQPIYTVHAMTIGELEYATDYVQSTAEIFEVEADG